MKKIVLVFIATLMFFNTGPLLAQDFQRGGDAYNAGDYATALMEWEPLAEQGVAAAQNDLGVMYDTGQGVPQDYKEAVKLYRLAAEQGLANAQNNLGNMYADGQGVPQDDKEAVKLYRLAAEQGLAAAQFNLALMYDEGQGVPQDYKIAYMWFNLAGANGYTTAPKYRDKAAKEMSQTDISKAQDMSRACRAGNYKNCP